MKLKFRYVLLAAGCAVATSFLAFTSYAQSSRSEREIQMDDDPLLQPLPRGIRVRAFIHTPRVIEPSHLGICEPTSDSGDQVNWYDIAPWRLQSAITWKLSESTLPPGIFANDARYAIKEAFWAWNEVINPNVNLFPDGGKTTAKNTRLDGTNAILWKRLREGVIGETYVWYNTDGEVVEVDTALNNRHPWKKFDYPPGPSYSDPDTDPLGDCSTQFDAYDLQNIATHEFGHWIGLGDVIGPLDLTMYLFGAGGELKKRTLGLGDKLGACLIYNSCP